MKQSTTNTYDLTELEVREAVAKSMKRKGITANDVTLNVHVSQDSDTPVFSATVTQEVTPKTKEG